MLAVRHLLVAFVVVVLARGLAAQAAPIELPLHYSGRHLYVTVTDEHLGPLTLNAGHGVPAHDAGGLGREQGRGANALLGAIAVVATASGSGGAKRRYLTTDLSLRSGPMALYRGSALVTDLGDVNRTFGHAFDGFLGWDFFRRWCATLEYAPARLTLRDPRVLAPPGPIRCAARGLDAAGAAAAGETRHSPTARTRRRCFTFDTGSDITLLLNTRFPRACRAGSEDDVGTGVAW